jgi:uncharacterized protein (DUF1015 family)
VAAASLASRLAPPYDVISPAQRLALLEQDPHNAVRIDLPADLGQADAEAYRGAARTVAEWRSARVLLKDRQPTLTVHRMTWQDATSQSHSCTGLFARLRLEAFGPGAGVLPHEGTMGGPKEDRYQLLKATGLNTSPIVLLAGQDRSEASPALASLAVRPPDSEATTPDGVTHQLWISPTPDRGLPGDPDQAARHPVAEQASDGDPQGVAGLALLDLLASAPLTIADGHHRYETALRYRAERASHRACESDPAWDYALALVYPVDLSPPALPTHRVIRGEPAGADLLSLLAGYAAIERLPDREALLNRMAEAPDFAPGAIGTGSLGLLTNGTAAVLRLDRAATASRHRDRPSSATHGLDVSALAAIIEGAYGQDAATMAEEGRLRYLSDARAATQQVEDGEATSCFLLHGMPPAAITRVASAGEVMPHKSTFFQPKAPSGLLFSPLEW